MPRVGASNKRPNPRFEIVMETNAVMRGELYPADAPQTVGNFIELANSGFYDGLTFHRCIPNFIIQGGKPAKGDLPYCIKGEFEFNRCKLNQLEHEQGSLCMSRSNHYDSASSQFFIDVTDDQRELACLDGAYAVFGKVLEGLNTAIAMASAETDDFDEPLLPQRIRRIRVETYGQTYPFEKLPPPTSNFNQLEGSQCTEGCGRGKRKSIP